MGVSGTIERKDQMHVVAEFILGPTVAVGVAPQLPCDVYITNTKTQLNIKAKGNFFWVMARKMLATNHRRNQIILNDLRNWASAGHTIIAVTETRDHIDMIVKQLKSEGIAAEGFHSKAFKKEKDQKIFY